MSPRALATLGESEEPLGSWLARAAYNVLLRLQDAAGAVSTANVTVIQEDCATLTANYTGPEIGRAHV